MLVTAVDNIISSYLLSVLRPLHEVLSQRIQLLLSPNLSLNVFIHSLRDDALMLVHHVGGEQYYVFRCVLLAAEFIKVLAEVLHDRFIGMLGLGHDFFHPFKVGETRHD